MGKMFIHYRISDVRDPIMDVRDPILDITDPIMNVRDSTTFSDKRHQVLGRNKGSMKHEDYLKGKIICPANFAMAQWNGQFFQQTFRTKYEEKKVQQQTSWILHLVYFLIAAVNFEIHDFKYWRAD
jgi:hypothetical protein